MSLPPSETLPCPLPPQGISQQQLSFPHTVQLSRHLPLARSSPVGSHRHPYCKLCSWAAQLSRSLTYESELSEAQTGTCFCFIYTLEHRSATSNCCRNGYINAIATVLLYFIFMCLFSIEYSWFKKEVVLWCLFCCAVIVVNLSKLLP